MATLYVTEFSSAVSGIGSAFAPVLPQPALAQQNLAIGATTNPSAAFTSKTNAVELYADAACTFIFGAAGAVPAVVVGGNRMASGERRVYAVPPGGYISVIN